MKAKIIVVAVCLTCLSTPAYTTGLLEAKIAAAAGVAKGAALLGAGALAAKGAVLKGVGSLLAAKGAAIKNVLAAKPVEVAVPTYVIEQPSMISKPCVNTPSVVVEQPTIVSKPSIVLEPVLMPSKPIVKPGGPLIAAEVNTPLVSAGVELASNPVVSLLGDRLTGLLNTIDQTLDNTLNKTVVVNTVRSPIVYQVVRTPSFYPVPIY